MTTQIDSLIKTIVQLPTSKHYESLSSQIKQIDGITYNISICNFFTIGDKALGIEEIYIPDIKQIIIEYNFNKINCSNFEGIKRTIDNIATIYSNNYPDHILINYNGNYKPYKNLLIPKLAYEQLNK